MRVINDNAATRRLYNEEICDEPIVFDPDTGEASLDVELPEDYRELQQLAKRHGISADQSEGDLREALEGAAGVPDELGEALCARYDSIRPYED